MWNGSVWLPRNEKSRLQKYWNHSKGSKFFFEIFQFGIITASLILIQNSYARITWVSERFNAFASSTRSGVERYLWASNRFSSPLSCWSLNTVRAFRRRQCFEFGSPPVNRELNGSPGNVWHYTRFVWAFINWEVSCCGDVRSWLELSFNSKWVVGSVRRKSKTRASYLNLKRFFPHTVILFRKGKWKYWTKLKMKLEMNARGWIEEGGEWMEKQSLVS